MSSLKTYSSRRAKSPETGDPRSTRLPSIDPRSLADRQILSCLKRLNRKERRIGAAILLYLSEIEKRRLHLAEGYSSLFDFCTSCLGYTRATAARRIRSARAVSRFPGALPLLLSGEINITTLSMVSNILNEENHRGIIESIRGRSTREVEVLLSRHTPSAMPRESIRPICVLRPTPHGLKSLAAGSGDADAGRLTANNGKPGVSADTCAGSCDGGEPGVSADTCAGSCDGGEPGAGAGTCAGSGDGGEPGAGAGNGNGSEADETPKVSVEQRFKISFSVTPDFIKRFERVRCLLSGAHPRGIGIEAVFDILMGEYIDRHAPERRHARRSERRKKGSAEDSVEMIPGASRARRPEGISREEGKKRPRCGEIGGKDDAVRRKRGLEAVCGRDRNLIPVAARDEVYARDGGRCAFIGTDGRRCGSGWDLEIDHVVPVAMGGDDSPGNLRLLCRAHNLLEAERALGRKTIADRIGVDPPALSTGTTAQVRRRGPG